MVSNFKKHLAFHFRMVLHYTHSRLLNETLYDRDDIDRVMLLAPTFDLESVAAGLENELDITLSAAFKAGGRKSIHVSPPAQITAQHTRPQLNAHALTRVRLLFDAVHVTNEKSTCYVFPTVKPYVERRRKKRVVCVREVNICV